MSEELATMLHFCAGCGVLRSPDPDEMCKNCHGTKMIAGMFHPEAARTLLAAHFGFTEEEEE